MSLQEDIDARIAEINAQLAQSSRKTGEVTKLVGDDGEPITDRDGNPIELETVERDIDKIEWAMQVGKIEGLMEAKELSNRGDNMWYSLYLDAYESIKACCPKMSPEEIEIAAEEEANFVLTELLQSEVPVV